MKCPCKDCLTLPICRQREYLVTFYHCRLIHDYLPHHNHGALRNKRKLELIYKIMKPKYWTLKIATRAEVVEGGKQFKGKLMVHNIDDKGEVFYLNERK